jgi:hypothetical protein
MQVNATQQMAAYYRARRELLLHANAVLQPLLRGAIIIGLRLASTSRRNSECAILSDIEHWPPRNLLISLLQRKISR